MLSKHSVPSESSKASLKRTKSSSQSLLNYFTKKAKDNNSEQSPQNHEAVSSSGSLSDETHAHLQSPTVSGSVQSVSESESHDPSVPSPSADADESHSASASCCSTDLPTSTHLAAAPENSEKSLVSLYDIGLFVGKRDIDDQTKEKLLESPWTPPENYKFPRSEHTKLGKTVFRSINHTHLKRHHWLAVSDVHGGLYCKYCVLFAPLEVVRGTGRRSNVGSLVNSALKSFSKLYGKDGALDNHEKNKYHIDAVGAGKDFLHTYKSPPSNIVNRLNAQRLDAMQDNRNRLKPNLKTIVFCGQQNVSLRGHRDDGILMDEDQASQGSIVENDGNFRSLLRFRIEAGDENLKTHLEKSSSRSTYIGKNTQNGLILCCGEEICEKICDEARQSPWFAIIFDETTDGSRKELMSVSVRYLRNTCNKGTVVCEKFLCYVDCYQAIRPTDISESGEKRLTGKALGHIVIDLFCKFNLDLKNRCVGVGTDNCAVMASEVKGAVAEIQKHAPLAVRCPCLNHILNNSLKKSNSVLACKTAVTKMKEVISFSNGSAKLNEVFKRHLGQAMTGLCETRWSEKHDGTLQFCHSLPKICDALEEISSWETSETSSKAYSLLKSLCDAEFIISVFALGDILALTRPLSLFLQSPRVDSVAASDSVKDVLSVLEKKRTEVESSFHLLYERVTAVVSEIDVEIQAPRVARRQGNRANHPFSSPEEYFRRAVFIPILDATLTDLKGRLSDEVLESFNLRVLLPLSMDLVGVQGSPLTPEIRKQLDKLAQTYDDALLNKSYLLESEYTMWVQKWRRIKLQGGDIPESAIQTIDACDSDMYPSIHTLLKILATLPVSVATAERSFSTLRRVKCKDLAPNQNGR
ncbi:52 kDa repressor of the inhibitor of the protein kinase [Frankliniella fusca]|uniref:52 kDa repressor of the inhibitor of the protein kinase n=1 Tax=Frankliniella fusca TaxID=407009 RepID=A0AAE1L8Y1_9NEOP|nr:52 kDa repressor of the inhibitor of the protein kinase [Frankliniella fusca]